MTTSEQFLLTILATQGYPYTGKTTLANALAARLKFSTVRFDDILDYVIPPGKTLLPPVKADSFKSHAFDLLIQTVKTQISLGISVIVDSPLSNRSQFEKLFALTNRDLRILIIECNPKIDYTWQMRFEKRDSSYKTKWYKPNKWGVDPEFKRDYADEDSGDYYSKLIVNTTNYVSYDHVVEALRDLASTTCTDGGRKVELENWRGQKSSARHHSPVDKLNKEFCRDGHFVNEYNEDGIDYYATCEVCEKVVTKGSAAYTCSVCPLAIHKSCAEAGGDKAAFIPKAFPDLRLVSRRREEEFDDYICLLCFKELSPDAWYYNCNSCHVDLHLDCAFQEFI